MRTRMTVVAISTACLVVLALSGVQTARQARPAAVPNPIVTGPIPATAPPGDPSHGYPFFSATMDLAREGYVEEEFFFEGTASRYNLASATINNTPMTTASVIGSGPYRTRMIVRRPASPNHFNGTVLMEWQNVTTGYDLDAGWVVLSEHIVRRGYAWIGVSAQRVGVHNAGVGLRAWSPVRYGTLDVTAGGTINDDSLQYDIYSQAAQAVRNPVGVDPMAGFAVERIFAVGVSQSAIRLVVYHNAVHPLAGVFDGFMPFEHGAKLRTDLDVKVFKVLSETDVARDQVPFRQPDSDRLRRWEIAGAAHLDFYAAQALKPLQARDLPPSSPTTCERPPLSRIPSRYVWSAALDAMVEWVRDGIEPPTGPDIEIETLTPVTIARDGFGNALGGIRLSQHEVPTATNTGINGPATNFCRTYGSFVPFDQATLDALYPDHGMYVSQVTQVTQENVKQGFIVREDAQATIRDAAQSGIGKS